MGKKFGQRLALTFWRHQACRKCKRKQPENLLATHEARCEVQPSKRKRQSKG